MDVVEPQFSVFRDTTRGVGLQPFQNLPAASQVDPRRLFPRPSARDCPTNGGLTNAAPPEPIDGRRAATQPTDNPRCAPPTSPPAATHRHRAPDATRLVVPPSCRTNISRAHAARTNRRETHRDAAHRRSGVRARAARCPYRPPPRTVTAPPMRPAFCSSELPHERLTSQCRPSQSTGDAPRRSPPTIRGARARAPPTSPPAASHCHRAPDATRLLVHTRAAARMPHEPMPPEPIDGRRTATQPTGRSIRGARRHAPSPRPRRDPTSTRAALLFHPSCRTASRANAARAYRRETHRDRRRTPPLLSTRVPALGQDARHASPACSERLGRAAVVCVRFRENSRDSGARAPAPCTMMVLDHHRPDERTRPTTEAH